MNTRKWMLVVSACALVATVVASCAPAATPTPQIIKQTVVATSVVKETVIAKETVVAKETVQVPVVVTPTPGIQEGGTLRRGMPTGWAIEGFNPLVWTNGGTEQMFRYCFNALIVWDTDFSKFLPDLAESYEVSPDGKVYTFHPRKGVKWQDGQPFTAQDAEFTYLMALNAKTGSTLKAGMSAIKGAADYTGGKATTVPGIQVVDDYTFKLETAEPNAPFITNVAITFIMPKHIFKDIKPEDIAKSDYCTKSPIGTGPYQVLRHVPGQYTELTRNLDYFRGAPHIEKVVVYCPMDGAVMVAALQKGELDYADNVSEAEVPNLKAAGLTIASVQWGYFGLFINTSRSYLKDKRVRQAILYALDRESIAKELYYGLTEPAMTYLDQGWIGLSPKLNPYKYDPDKAKALLKEAGWDSTRELNFYVYGGSPGPQVLAIQSQLQAVGIKTKIETVTDVPALIERFYKQRDYDISYGGRGYGLDPDMIKLLVKCNNYYPDGYNATDYCNPRVDELLALGAKTVDLEARKKIYLEMQEILNDDFGETPAFKGTVAIVYSPKLKNVRAVYRSMGINYDASQEWWIAQK